MSAPKCRSLVVPARPPSGPSSAPIIQICVRRAIKIRQSLWVTVDDVTALAELLLARWDPVGVAETDFHPESEYRHEASALLALLVDGGSLETVTAFLTDQRLGTTDPARDASAAAHAVAWFRNRS